MGSSGNGSGKGRGRGSNADRHQHSRHASQRAFTLIEVAVVCAIVAVTATIALPSYRSHVLHSARLDAVDALTRVQTAQERHRALTGLYANDLGALRLPAASRQGFYSVQMASTGPDGYAVTAVANGAQAQDTRCTAISLDVNRGFAQPGPHPQCWNR